MTPTDRPPGRRKASGGQSTVSLLHYYRHLFELNLAGLYRTTLDGRILECNHAMAKMFGYSSTRDLHGRLATELYFGDADRRTFLAKLKKRGVLRNNELLMRKKDGSPIVILENVSLVPDANGKPTHIQGTMVDITKLKRIEESLRESEQRHRIVAADLRRLTQHLQTVREDERARIARELHDELGQDLTALKLDLHWLQGRLGDGMDAARSRIDSMCALLERTVYSVKGICADLRPTILDDFGLTAAIEWQAREFERRTGIRCQLRVPPSPVRLPKDQETAIFRILQESLTNAARHARATEVSVTLKLTRRAALLSVADNGIGIRREQAEGPLSLGLAGMRERALPWDGQLTITGSSGHGTTVTVRMPVGASLKGPAGGSRDKGADRR